MKKYSILFVLFSVAAIIFLWFTSDSKKQFISIKENKFVLDGKEFYPVAVNYLLSFQTDGSSIWPSPSNHYGNSSKFLYTTRDSCLLQLKADMELIKEMGFNTIRLGMEPSFNAETKELSMGMQMGRERDTTLILSKGDYNPFLNALEELFATIDSAGLKVIFLTRILPGEAITEDHIIKIALHFRNNPTILAYDFFNEPLYFDTPERPKKEIFNLVRGWRTIMTRYAPNHLCTIGLEGIREVFEWDPNILDIDFVSLHPYEYEPDQVRNEIYWYGKYIEKPWIIGETSLSADDDSVSYEDQKNFAHKTFAQSYNCGAAGYSWWQYKDVEWHSYHANYMGVVNVKGETKTKKSNLVVIGTPKPVVDVFKNFDATSPKDSCICLENYYNYSPNKDFKIKGILLDEDNDPIQGGVILAWNEWWTHSYHTVTKEDGSFELYSNYPFYHWMASATKYSMVRGDVSPDTARVDSDKIPTLNLGKISIEKLSYIN